MLCQFSFKNFRSYKDETVLDLQAVASSKDETKNFKESLLRGSDGKEFLPVSVIYGPNAGGKTNVLEAFICAVGIVLQPVFVLKALNIVIPVINSTPFKFDDISSKKPTEFMLFFRPDEEYEYKYFIAVQNGTIIEEYLYRRRTKPGSRASMVFERVRDSIKLGSCIGKSNINTQINDSIPYLSFLAVNYKLEPIITVIDWFEKCAIYNYSERAADSRTIAMLKDSKKRDSIIKLMNDVGINISNLQVKDSCDMSNRSVLVEHTVNSEKFHLALSYESDGTKKLLNILPYVLEALSKGRVLTVDELDAKLHPKLLKYIIMLFKNPEINKHNAQLIFTSHDISTMKSSVFRTDEIWFACKREDESSDLYSLYEIKDENGNHIQPNASFDKQYLEGRYGADPYFRNMMEWK